MESANLHLHHHQLQEQLVGCYSLADQPGHKVPGTHHWNPSFLLNQNITTNNGYHSESISTSGGFLWPPPVSSLSSDRLTQQSPSELLLASIKDETSASFPKLSEMRHGPSNAEDSPLLSIKHQPMYSHDQNLRLNDFSYLQQELSARDLYPNDPESVSLRSAAACSRYSFGHFVPTSDFYSSLVSSCSPNLVALHGLSSTYDGGSPGQSSNENLGKLKEAMFMGSNHMPEKDKLSSCSSIKEISALVSGGTRFKRPGSFPDSVESGGESKKCRSTARSSCPPLKVRKEKLGDRIAALQKLVAPFGKTDTASVLTEAIGYIQFLHDQVQTLSVPYMKQPHRPCRTKLAGSSKEQEKEEPMPDLRSRGLCLVPLSCASLFNIYSDSFYTTP